MHLRRNLIYSEAYFYLESKYDTGHSPVKFEGDNLYPYNLDRFKMLFGIDY